MNRIIFCFLDSFVSKSFAAGIAGTNFMGIRNGDALIRILLKSLFYGEGTKVYLFCHNSSIYRKDRRVFQGEGLLFIALR